MDTVDWSQFYIDELKETDTSNLKNFIDFDLLTAKNNLKMKNFTGGY